MHPQQALIVDREIKDSFQVSRLGRTDANGTSSISVVYNRIFIVYKGAGALRVDDRDQTISGNEIFLVSKGQIFSVSAGTTLEGIEISFGDCFWERTPASASNCKAVLFNNAALNQRLPLTPADAATLNPVLDMLMGEYEGADYPNKLDAMAAYLKVIMIKLANINALANPEINNGDSNLYRRFLELVSTNYSRTHEVADFARELSVTARKLSDLCKQKSGNGAKEIINGHVIAEAKRSLQFSAKPIKQIAYDLSFATPEQFSHFFKKNTDIAPADYRNVFVNIGRQIADSDIPAR